MFPVPDGDTGTNMYLTVEAAALAAAEVTDPASVPGPTADALARGALLGARGNSGVILSQLLRGLADVIATTDAPTGQTLVAAMQRAADMAALGAAMAFKESADASLLDVVARDLRVRLGMLVYTCSWFNLPLGPAMEAFDARERRFGIHGGAIETSLMLALHPDAVRTELVKNFDSTSEARAVAYSILGNGHSAKLAWQMQDYNIDGATGHATAAHADQGHALLDATSRALASLLIEFDHLPLSTLR